jgi:hypothetical protein
MFKAAFLIQTEGIPSWIAELSGDFTGCGVHRLDNIAPGVNHSLTGAVDIGSHDVYQGTGVDWRSP